MSYRLHQYIAPAPGDGSLNIPFLVSNGYLICTPDIGYTKGKTGESALEYVTAAANHIGKLPYVEAKKMGIQGHSFGGYQVNYIVAKSNLFAAAQPSAGALARGAFSADLIKYLDAGHLWHIQIKKDNTWFRGRMVQDLHQLLSIFQRKNLVSPVNLFHSIPEEAAVIAVVFGVKDVVTIRNAQ